MEDIINFLIDLFITMADSGYKNTSFAIAPVIGAAAIGGVASVLGSIFSSSSQEKSSLRNIRVQASYNKQFMAIQQEYQKELAALQQQYAVENWERENEYNLPINQRQRLLDAGVNPNFADVVDNGSAGAVAAPAQGSAPAANPPNIAAIDSASAQKAQTIQNAFEQGANVAKTVAETQSITADSKIKNIQSLYTEQLMQGTLELNTVTIDLMYAQKESEHQRCYILAKEGRKLDAEVSYINTNMNYLRQLTYKTTQEYENAKAQLNLIHQEIRTSQAQENLFVEEANQAYETSETARQLREPQRLNILAQTALAEASKENVDEDTKLKKVQEAYTHALTAETKAKEALAYAQTAREKAEAQKAYAEARYYKMQSIYQPAVLNNLAQKYASESNLNDEEAKHVKQLTRFAAAQALQQELTNQVLQEKIEVPVRVSNGKYVRVPMTIVQAQGVMKLQLDESAAREAFSKSNLIDENAEWVYFNNCVQNARTIVSAVNETLNTVSGFMNGSGGSSITPFTGNTTSTLPMMTY